MERLKDICKQWMNNNFSDPLEKLRCTTFSKGSEKLRCTTFSSHLLNILPSPKEGEARLDQAKQWGFSLFKEALENYCADGGFKALLLLSLLLLPKLCLSLLLWFLIFVCCSTSTYIDIKARSEPTSSTRLWGITRVGPRQALWTFRSRYIIHKTSSSVVTCLCTCEHHSWSTLHISALPASRWEQLFPAGDVDIS